VIVAGVLISKCGGYVKDTNVLKKEDKRLIQIQAKLDSSNRAGNSLKDSLGKEVLKQKIELAQSKRVIKVLNNKLEEYRIPVKEIIEANPDLDKFVDLGDSIRKYQAALLDTVTNQKDELWRSMNVLLSIEQSKTALEHEKGLIFEEQRNRYKKKADKRFTVGPFVGVDYKLQATFGVGVQYRLFRF